MNGCYWSVFSYWINNIDKQDCPLHDCALCLLWWKKNTGSGDKACTGHVQYLKHRHFSLVSIFFCPALVSIKLKYDFHVPFLSSNTRGIQDSLKALICFSVSVRLKPPCFNVFITKFLIRGLITLSENCYAYKFSLPMGS